MALDDLVSVTITAETTTPTKPGFGTPLLVGYHTVFNDRVRTYKSVKAMKTDGFAASHPLVLAATAVFSQKVRPKQIKVGRRALAYTKAFTLTCLSATEGDVYDITINGEAVTYTVLASATTTTVATAIELLVEAVTGISSTSSGAVITMTGASGAFVTVKDWSHNLSVKDTTADPGIETDMDAILAADPDWYGLILDSQSKAEVLGVADWVESNRKLFGFDMIDTEVTDSGVSNDVMSSLKTLAYARTYGLYSNKSNCDFGAAAWMAQRFTSNPGSDTWMFKTLVGVNPSYLTDTEYTNLRTKKANIYTTVSGINMTQDGWSASGEFLDVTRFVDWLQAEIQVRVFTRLANSDKIPYTDGGVDLIKSIIASALTDGTIAGGLAADPAPTVTAPLVADVSSLERANRNLPDVEFQGRLAGAIHSLEITGRLAV